MAPPSIPIVVVVVILEPYVCPLTVRVSQLAANTFVFPLVWTYTYVAHGRSSQSLYGQSSDARAIGVVGGRASQVGLHLIKNLEVFDGTQTHSPRWPSPLLPQPQFHVPLDCWYVYDVCTLFLVFFDDNTFSTFDAISACH